MKANIRPIQCRILFNELSEGASVNVYVREGALLEKVHIY